MLLDPTHRTKSEQALLGNVVAPEKNIGGLRCFGTHRAPLFGITPTAREYTRTRVHEHTSTQIFNKTQWGYGFC